jgi:MEMO1 family protein
MSHRDERPKLRVLHIERIDYNGPHFVLRDPLQLHPGYLLIPEALGPLLGSFDGRNSYAELQASVTSQLGAVSGPALLNEILAALDQACLLENHTYHSARSTAITAYRAAAYRPLSMAGHSYPADPAELRKSFDQLLAAVPGSAANNTHRGIFSPHIDYQRGGPIYAQVWQQASTSAQHAKLVILLATDHYSPEPFTLTYQRYATPYGAFDTDPTLVAKLAEAIGPHAFDAELYHRHEHSIELVANWLHHMRNGQPCTLIPILCGSFQRYTQQATNPMNTPHLHAFVTTLAEIITTHEALVVVSGDLAHVGPAFGDPALDPMSEERLVQDDQQILEQFRAGDADQLLATIRQVHDRNRVCGLPPGYIALKALGGVHGTHHGYQRCPADEQNTSAVTIAGFTFA